MDAEHDDDNRTYPEGHFIGMWMGIGIAIFSGVGVALSAATDNPGLIGIGPALGVAVGLAIGTGVEERHKKAGRIRPAVPGERNRRRTAVVIGLLVLLGALVLLTALLAR